MKIWFSRWLIVVLLFLNWRVDLSACAPAPRNGQFVTINEESAVIVWDAQTRTEHFIRTASFSGADDFGFLVPTPTKPELAEARNALQTVSQLIHPKYIHEPRFDGFNFTPVVATFFLAGSARDTAVTAIPSGDVRVLGEQQVAGYDAVILEADNAQSLNKWLAKHGYESRPALVEWLEPYVRARWKITAFKIAANNNRVSTSPVRMSFTTDKPFFPYREPVDLRGENARSARTLKVFFLSDARMQGTLGTQPWHSDIVFANRVEESLRSSLASECGLAPSQLPANLWLTTFEDKSVPRPGIDEVFFLPATIQNTTSPPPIIITDDWQIPLPLDLLLLAILLLWFTWFRHRRKRPTLTVRH